VGGKNDKDGQKVDQRYSSILMSIILSFGLVAFFDNKFEKVI